MKRSSSSLPEPMYQFIIHHAKKGEKVPYLGYRWKVIDVLPYGSRVLYRPWWKLRKTGVLIT